ncbi:unnamed protein product, partial [Adineta steineri]
NFSSVGCDDAVVVTFFRGDVDCGSEK